MVRMDRGCAAFAYFFEGTTAHAKISAYFNLDNGTGKVRGVYTQRNAAALRAHSCASKAS